MLFPIHFFFFISEEEEEEEQGREGWSIGRSCSRQCRLSQMPDEIKCDWRGRAADGEGLH